MTAQKPTSSLPARKSKATAPKSRPAANPFRSAEFVEDSDISEGAETEASKKKKESKITTSAPVTSKPVPPRARTSTSKPSERRTSPSQKSLKESSRESSDNNGSEASSSSQEWSLSPTKPEQSAARSVQPKPSHGSSVEKAQLSKSKTNMSNVTKEISSQSESEGDSESSQSGSESESGSSDQTSLHSPRKRSPIRKPTSKQLAIPYEPPFGFKASSIAIHPSSKATELFSPTKLLGKEIWHITAPASVPIGSIREVPIQNIQSRTSIMSYKGADFGLVLERGAEAASSRALLLPSTQTSDYRISASKITTTLHLQQIMNLPIHTISSAKSSHQTGSAPEPLREAPRQQPEGLRMRYHPFGASDDSDSEMLPENAVEAPQFHVPTPAETSPAKKRKRAEKDTAIEVMDATPTEMKTKKRKTKGEAAGNGADTAIDVDTTDTQKLPENAPKDKAHNLTNGTTSHAPSRNGILPQQTEEAQHEKKKKKKHKPLEQPPAPISALPSVIVKEAETIMPEEVVDGASAIDITHSEAKKAKRREEKRKRKEAEQESHGEAGGKMNGDVAHVKYRRSESREEEAQMVTPMQSSPQRMQGVVNGGPGSVQVSSRTSQRQETKEERAKRKEEKRRRKMVAVSA